MNKLALGTAQFGLDYGVNNHRGKVPKEEVFAILDRAAAFGVDLLDTAQGYGESEAILGEYLKISPNRFRVISKLPNGKAADLKGIPIASLTRLGINSFYGYILHDFNSFRKDNDVWEILKDLKTSGKTEKIGFSLYYPFELEFLLGKGISFDLLQLPYSIFDRRFEYLFKAVKDNGIELHVRSVFLQGLVFKRPEELSPEFYPIREKLAQLRRFAADRRIGVADLCLNFCLLNNNVDRAVIGVDSISNLEEIITAARETEALKYCLPELGTLREDNESVLVPSNWARMGNEVLN